MIHNMPEKLKKLRKSKGLSLKEVADRIGDKSVSIISDYENGHRTPSVVNLMKLATLYEVSSDYLLGIDKNKICIDTSELSEKQVTAILQLIEAIKE